MKAISNIAAFTAAQKARVEAQRNGGGDDVVARLNSEYAVAMHGAEVCIIREEGQQDVHFMTPQAFHLWHANDWAIGPDGKPAPISRIWIKDPRRRQYAKIVFDPQDNDPTHYNLWRGFSVAPGPGKCSKFLDHVHVNICNGNDEHYLYVIGWLAHMVQRPWEKPGVALVLRGKEEVGKGRFADIVGRLLVRRHYVAISHSSHLTGRFNAHLKLALLAFVDEAFWAGDKAGEGALKHLVTDRDVTIEAKFHDPMTLPNLLRLIIASNEDWVVPAGTGARRWLVLDVAEHSIQNREYFQEIEDEIENGGLGALMQHLQNFDLSLVDIFTAPKTAALLEQKHNSFAPHQAWWHECLKAGSIRYLYEDNEGYESKGKTIGWPDTEQNRILRTKLWNSLRLWQQEHNTRSRVIASNQLWQWFYKHSLLEGLETVRETTGKRDRLIILPSLEDCRSAFDRMVGQTQQWEQEESDNAS